jgi:hypothetical protein
MADCWGFHRQSLPGSLYVRRLDDPKQDNLRLHNTIGVSDGISMGTEGMSYSLQSRDLIVDSIENGDGRTVV